MIEVTTGNLLEADADALVNTVNCVGVMGKGIALQFRYAEPENYRYYQAACRKGQVRLGEMLVFDKGAAFHPRYIINFPTKQHWRDRSHLEDIASGLEALKSEVERLGIKSIAVPPLGCGNGGLRWDDVRPLVEAAFSQLEGVRVLLYAPEVEPSSMGTKVATGPELAKGEAMLLLLIASYAEQMYRLTTLVVQSLAYFIQASGQPLNLKFSQGQYGPYAADLDRWLQRLEGGYICGYRTRNDNTDIRLTPDAAQAASHRLADDIAAEQRLARVERLIQGFETPYGSELLASVHWIAEQGDHQARHDLGRTINGVHAWSERKAKFPPEHIRAAWQRLRGEGWLAGEPLSEELQLELALN
ncbi:MAG: Appr-1-p processing protein [Candidatus Chloroheliales bacterium]|nr:MAG: Appr-1-p processing protein [Chloroflexota bacterium]